MHALNTPQEIIRRMCRAKVLTSKSSHAKGIVVQSEWCLWQMLSVGVFVGPPVNSGDLFSATSQYYGQFRSNEIKDQKHTVCLPQNGTRSIFSQWEHAPLCSELKYKD